MDDEQRRAPDAARPIASRGGLLSAEGLARFEAALKTDEATPAEYLAFLDHIEARRGDEDAAPAVGP